MFSTNICPKSRVKEWLFAKAGVLSAFLLVVCVTFSAAADSDTRTVQAQFDRCASAMERVERSLRRYEDEIRSLKYTGNNLAAEKRETFQKDVAALENRLEYLRNRYERATGQADRIRDDLKNVSGPTCPSCVESSVKLYCRNAEGLQTDIDEYLAKAGDLRSRADMQKEAPGQSNAFTGRYAALDSAYQALADENTACSDKAAAALLQQAGVNLARADSLHAAGDETQAVKSLDIAGTLLEKAGKRCAEK